MKYRLFILSIMLTSQAFSQSQPPLLFNPDEKSHSSSERNTEVNTAFSAAATDTSRVTLNAHALTAAITGNKGEFALRMMLPGERSEIILTVTEINDYVDTVKTLSGHVGSDHDTFFTLSLQGKQLTGKVVMKAHTYIVEPDQQTDTHRIVKVQPARLPQDEHDTEEAEAIYPNHGSTTFDTAPTGAAQQSHGNVRVLTFYAADVYNGESLAATIISEFNRALRTSGVDGKYISSAGVIPMTTRFHNQCKRQIIRDMDNNIGPFAALDRLRINANADIVFTIVNDRGPGFGQCFPGFSGRVGGIARGPSLFFWGAENAHAVTADSYVLADNTAAHEIGHVLGLFHPSDNRAVSPRIGTINPPMRWQSMMGSYDAEGCYFTGINTPCMRLNRFSNPDQTYNGAPLGSATQNAALWLRNTAMDRAANFVNSSPPIPGRPEALSVISGHCYGFNDVVWSGSDANTLDYRLYRSTRPDFRYPVRVYRGMELSTPVNIRNRGERWYLRVQACNASGCSGYSNQAIAIRLDACL